MQDFLEFRFLWILNDFSFLHFANIAHIVLLADLSLLNRTTLIVDQSTAYVPCAFHLLVFLSSQHDRAFTEYYQLPAHFCPQLQFF